MFHHTHCYVTTHNQARISNIGGLVLLGVIYHGMTPFPIAFLLKSQYF